MSGRCGALALVALLGCAPPSVPQADGGPDPRPQADGGDETDDSDGGDGGDACPAPSAVLLDGEEGETLVVDVPAGCALTIPVQLREDALVEVTARGATLSLDGTGEDEAGWVAARRWSQGDHELFLQAAGDEDVAVVFQSHGAPVDVVLIERSLVWTSPSLVEDPTAVGLGRVMAAVAADGHGGRLFSQWLTRFSTTAHSERLGPALLREELESEHGADASAWDLDALPFVVTGVHNRVDLRGDDACGELRVSVASLHEVWRPLHLIFLFRQPPLTFDRSPAGAVHCLGTARRWARLSLLQDDDFVLAARALLEEGLRSERFLLAESEELTVSPWEWRQWALLDNTSASDAQALPLVFENPPLFQTLDIAAVNAPGPLRESFLAFVDENAAALEARRAQLPVAFRPRSVRVSSGVPWAPLDLDGLPAATLSAYPRLRQHLEVIGCAGCHTAGEFVQTREDRSFSVFYEGELLARRDHLAALHRGDDVDRAPFGALQADPPLTP